MHWTRLFVLVVLAISPTAARAQQIPREDLQRAWDKVIGSSASATTAASATTMMNQMFDLKDVDLFRRAGWRAIDKGYYDTAEHEFLSAIKAARRPGLDDPRIVARCYADYAWALQKQGRNAQAEPLLKWSLIAREASLEPTSPRISQNLNQLATLYGDLGRFSEAEPLLRRAIETQDKARTPDLLEQARSQTLMGLLLTAQRRFAEAERFFTKALSLGEKAKGPTHPDTADAITNLGWAYHEQGKDDEARPLFERALGIIERSRGEADYAVGAIARGLGEIAARRHEVDPAETYFRRSVAILEKYPDEGLSLLDVLRHYANLLEENGRMADYARIKARIDPLRAKYTMPRARLGTWYRFPEAPSGIVLGSG